MSDPAPGTTGSGAPQTRALPDNLFGWAFVLGLGALLFFVGYAVGRETAPARVPIAASPSPTASATATESPATSASIDASALEGQWLFEMTETADTCGRHPASYSENVTISITNDTLRLPESVPPGTGEADEAALEATGTVSRTGAFSAEAETPDEAASARQIRYGGTFSSESTGRGSYEIERADCRAAYSFRARKLS